jgi:M6 family metalloprotease-like protein
VKIIGLGILVGALAAGGLVGCSQGSGERPVEVEAPEASVEPVTSLYETCDTQEVQPLTVLDDPRWKMYSYGCPSDRKTPTTALAYDPGVNDLEQCQLIETSWGRGNYPDANNVGFPRQVGEYRLADGVHKVAFIPVQWPDLRGVEDPLTLAVPAAKKVDEWYSIYTRGEVSFDWQFHDTWITLPFGSARYSQSEAQQNTDQWGDENVGVIDFFWSTALEAADPSVDFTGVEIVYFILPANQNVSAEFNLWPPGNGSFETDEGTINRGFTPGSYQFRQEDGLWHFWVHETLHYLRLPDLYWVDQNSVKRTEFTLPGPMQGYDMLTNQDGQSLALNGWLMWLSGWLSDSEVYCVTPENFQESSFEITPLSTVDNSLKSVMVKLSNNTALVIESRRKTDLETQVGNRSRDGVLVYHVDTSIGHGEGPLTLLAPHGRTLVRSQITPGSDAGPNLDAILYEGNSIEIAGYKVTVNEHKEHSDVISISRVPDFHPGSDPTYVCFTKENRDMSLDYPLSCPIVY